MRSSTREIGFVAIFSAIIAVMAQISIPMPYGVPMTMQTLAIPLAGIVLGSKKGALSTFVYILIGAVGIPVFAGFSGGLGVVFGKTGGFILSFPIMALLAGMGMESGTKRRLYAGLTAGAAINYLCGMLMFIAITGSSLHTAFVGCVLPFIPTAVIKIVLSGLLGVQIKKALKPIMQK